MSKCGLACGGCRQRDVLPEGDREELAARLLRAEEKYDWSQYSDREMIEKIEGEVGELREAAERGQLIGRHGMLDELYDVLTTVLRMKRRCECRL